jgi:hypothetical protein
MEAAIADVAKKGRKRSTIFAAMAGPKKSAKKSKPAKKMSAARPAKSR